MSKQHRFQILLGVSLMAFMLPYHVHAQTSRSVSAPEGVPADAAAMGDRLNTLVQNAAKTPMEDLKPTPVTGNEGATAFPPVPTKTTYASQVEGSTDTASTAPTLPGIPGLPPLPNPNASRDTTTSAPTSVEPGVAEASKMDTLNAPDGGVTPLNMPSPEDLAAAPMSSDDPTAKPLSPAEANSTASAMNQAALAPADASAANAALNPAGLPALPPLPMPDALAPDASALPPIVDANGLAVANPTAPLPSLAFDDLDDKDKKAKGKKAKKSKKKKSNIAFDYHRQELPPTISKAAYNMDNRHLPQAMYWQQLEMDMFYAARSGNLNAMRALVTKGVSVNLHNQLGEPLITLAARYGHADVVHWLIVHGSRVNDVSAQGQTPLHIAIAKGDAKMVKVLLDGGADANMPDERGVYPLAMASERGMSDASTVLKEYGAM